MNRIIEKFAELASQGRKGFIPFVSAGDPNLAVSEQILLALAEGGADIIELGVPFTDPMADGPTIQASSMRALKGGANLADILIMVRRIRHKTNVPIVLFSYLNPLYRYGIEKLSKDAANAGVDGILVTDAVDNEAAEIRNTLRNGGLELISLVAPTTSDERLAAISKDAGGFIYAVSRAGVTGARNETDNAAELLVNRVRKFTDLPVAVGFGISTRQQIEEVWQYADAAVVGSAIVAEISKAIGNDDPVERVRKFIATLLPPVAIGHTEI